MTAFRCPSCNSETTYRSMSGGREYWCDTCQDAGQYPEEGEGLPRATLLRTPEGAAELREMMRVELDRRRTEGEARE